VILGCRPEAGKLAEDGPLGAEVYTTDLHGAYTMLNVSCDDQLVHIRAPRGVRYRIGATVRFDIDPEMVRFFHPETEAAITRRVR
jgi:ABC-type sugar transport system ATPase subunit